jgi:hypothetical protein
MKVSVLDDNGAKLGSELQILADAESKNAVVDKNAASLLKSREEWWQDAKGHASEDQPPVKASVKTIFLLGISSR